MPWKPAGTRPGRWTAAQFWSALHGYVVLELAGMGQVVEDPEHSVLWTMLSNLLSPLRP